MNALLLTDLVGSVIVILGALMGGVRVVRGLARWIARLGDNTAATEKLTEVVSEIRDDIRGVVATLGQHGKQLDDHEGRIGRLEDRGHGGTP